MATAHAVHSKKPESHQPPKTRKRKSRAFRYGCLLMLALLLAGTYFAPFIIANTSLGQWVLQSALKLDGTVSLGSTSLGWFSSVVVENLEIRDASGDVLLKVDSLRTDKSLLGLLLDVTDLGQVHVDRPLLHVVAREKDSNLEQAFASLLKGPGGSQVTAQVEITDGTILIDDAVAGRKFRIEKLAVACAISDVDETIGLTASGALSDEVQPGSFKIDLHTKGSAKNETALASGKIDCHSSGLPLELIEPLLRRRVEKAQFTGRLSTSLAGGWGDMAEGGKASVSGEAIVTELIFGAAGLGEDRIQLDRVEVPCHILQNGEQVQIEKLALNCSLGGVTLSGSAKMTDFSAADKLSALARENYDLKGTIDLKQLARMLPKTLSIRAGTEITSGELSLVLSGRQQPDGMTWSGKADASGLGAQADGRALVWENPLSIEFAMHESQHGIVVDRAHCASNFLQIDAAGSIDELTASAKFDLAQLVTQLRQFSDLNQLRLAGQGQAQLAWKRTPDDQFAADGTFEARGLQIVAAHFRPWKEDDVVAKLDVSGQLSQHSVKRVDRAQITVDALSEQLKVELRDAVSDPRAAAWPVQCSWRGQLAYWGPRLEYLGIAPWDLGGSGSIQATLTCSSKAIEVEQAKLDFAQFRAVGGGWYIDEPAASGTFAGRVDNAQARIEITQGKLALGNASVVLSHAVLQTAATGWTLAGATAQVDAELANLYRWRHDPRTPAAWQVSGHLAGQADLKYDAGALAGRVDGTIDQLQVADLTVPMAARGTSAIWSEPRVALAASGSYQTAAGQLQLDKIQLAAHALECNASGAIALSAQGGNVDLKGTVQYDWEQLAPVWRPYLGPSAQIAGRQTRPFAVHGALSGEPTSSESWRQITGEAAVGWTGMNVDGLAVGPGEVVAQLGNGQLRTQPIEVQISEGRLTVAPVVRLSPAPAELLLGAGPLVTDVHLTPELCGRGLKFIAPILAESTVAEGRFSIVMDGGRIPLSNPGAGDASGRMALRAQAKPGPLAQQFLVLITELATILRQGLPAKLNDQSGAVLSIDDSNIEFRMVGGRVYHRGLTFVAGTTPITTHGYVGFDETLGIVAEVPVRATLLGIDLSLGTLEGTTLQIPIEGTLSKPKFDRTALLQLPGKIVKSATRGVLIDEVHKQLEKLFPAQP